MISYIYQDKERMLTHVTLIKYCSGKTSHKHSGISCFWIPLKHSWFKGPQFYMQKIVPVIEENLSGEEYSGSKSNLTLVLLR